MSQIINRCNVVNGHHDVKFPKNDSSVNFLDKILKRNGNSISL